MEIEEEFRELPNHGEPIFVVCVGNHLRLWGTSVATNPVKIYSRPIHHQMFLDNSNFLSRK